MTNSTRLAALTAMLALTATAAFAAYPEKPVTLILPVSAGGATDVGARTYAPYIGKCLGGEIVVSNMPGGSSVIGISAVAASEPDGYTFGTLNMPNLVTTTIAAERNYTIDSFVYLGNVVGSISAFSVQNGSEVDSLDALVEMAKSGPVRVGIGTIGSDDHLAFMRFARLAGIELDYIPFGDEARARNALLGGNADVIGMSATAALNFKDEITVIGAASAERASYAPDIPTFIEQGYDLISGSMHVLGMPKGTPDDVVEKMRACIAELPQNQEFLDEAAKRNVGLKFLSAEEVETAIRAEDTELRQIWAESPWLAQ